MARSPKTYALPSGAIEPSSTTALPVRSQISRASFRGKPRVRRSAHQTKHVLNSFVGDKNNGWRLRQLHCQPLPKRLIKHWIARRIREVGDDNGVLLPQNMRPLP